MTDLKAMFRAVETEQRLLTAGEKALRELLIKQIREIQDLENISDPALTRMLLRAKGQGVDVAGHLVRTGGVMIAPSIAIGTELAEIALGAKPKHVLQMSHSVKKSLLQSIIDELESREKNTVHDEASMLRTAFGI